jgi:predicted tellurium resistance membrane protein TerC
MDTSQFFTALMAIVVIDLVLAGDNAIVIALAARALPPDLQKRAIVWGAVGAIVVRSVMTLALVWLLKIPGLMPWAAYCWSGSPGNCFRPTRVLMARTARCRPPSGAP